MNKYVGETGAIVRDSYTIHPICRFSCVCQFATRTPKRWYDHKAWWAIHQGNLARTTCFHVPCESGGEGTVWVGTVTAHGPVSLIY